MKHFVLNSNGVGFGSNQTEPLRHCLTVFKRFGSKIQVYWFIGLVYWFLVNVFYFITLVVWLMLFYYFN